VALERKGTEKNEKSYALSACILPSLLFSRWINLFPTLIPEIYLSILLRRGKKSIGCRILAKKEKKKEKTKHFWRVGICTNMCSN